MNDQQFDDFIKNKLQNHSSAVPDGVWERIQAKRENERRGIAWWQQNKKLIIGLTALLLTSYVVFIGTNFPVEQAAVSTSSTEEAPASIKPSSSSPDKTLVPGSEANQPGHENDPLSSSAGSPAATNAIDAPAADVATKNANNQEVKRAVEGTASSIAGAHATTVRGKNTGAKNRERFSRLNGRNIVSGHVFEKEIGKQSHDADQEVAAGVEAFQAFHRADVALLLAKEKNVLASSPTSPIRSNKMSWPITDCPSASGSRRSDWFVEVFASPDYAIKSVEANNNEFLRRKDSTEKIRSAFTAGIRLSKKMGEHLVMKTGLQYSQINERFDYKSENERKAVTVITVRTIIRSPGDTVRVTDTSTLEQVGYRVKTTYNRYRSIDIPLIIGYEFGNENFRTSINGGLIFNLLSWQHGDMLDTTFTPVAFNKSSASFKRNVGLGIYAGLQFLKPIGERTEVFAEPYFHYRISSMTNDGSPFNQRFHAAGINFGIRYKINGGRQQ